MTRRQAAGLLLAALLIAGGRLVRHALLVDGAGAWRDPLLLESCLPPESPESLPEAAILDSAAVEKPKDTARERAAGPTPAFTGVLDVNHCSADSLTLLPGLGPALSGRVVADRQERGPFHSAKDLERVHGIGPRLAARLAPRLRFAMPADSGSAAAAPDAPVNGR